MKATRVRRRARQKVTYPRECHSCRQVFETKGRFDHHMNKVHIQSKSKKVNIDSLPPIASFQEGGRTLYGCPKCGKKCTQRGGVTDHLASVHGLKVQLRKYCAVCKKGFHSSESSRPTLIPTLRIPTRLRTHVQPVGSLCVGISPATQHLYILKSTMGPAHTVEKAIARDSLCSSTSQLAQHLTRRGRASAIVAKFCNRRRKS